MHRFEYDNNVLLVYLLLLNVYNHVICPLTIIISQYSDFVKSLLRAIVHLTNQQRCGIIKKSKKKKKKQHRGLSVISQNSCRKSLVLTNLAWGVVTYVSTYSDRSVYTPERSESDITRVHR